MKTNHTPALFAGALLFAASPLLADDHGKSAAMEVDHPVTADHAKGATLWDYHGNKLGDIEHVLLAPGDSGALAVIDTSVLDDAKKIVVPWNLIKVQTEKTDAGDIIFALDANKASLAAAPAYDGDVESLAGKTRECCEYWDRSIKEAVKESANKVGRAFKEAGEEIKKAVTD